MAMDIDEAEQILEAAALALPGEFYRDLNGGVSLVADWKRHPQAPGLYVLGEYHHEPFGLGRYILIYFGSLQRVCAGLSREAWAKQLEDVLRHEFTHHIESLAGERGLEVRDAVELEGYLGFVPEAAKKERT
jgi:predicted Zn-dependent protease with MMP-like domain